MEHLRDHAEGRRSLVVVLNGVEDGRHPPTRKFASGPIALQWGRGTIKFRKVEIRPIWALPSRRHRLRDPLRG